MPGTAAEPVPVGLPRDGTVWCGFSEAEPGVPSAPGQAADALIRLAPSPRGSDAGKAGESPPNGGPDGESPGGALGRLPGGSNGGSNGESNSGELGELPGEPSGAGDGETSDKGARAASVIGRRTNRLSRLRRAAAWFLSGFAAFVFSCYAANALLRLEFGGEDLIRALVGECAGGYENVAVLKPIPPRTGGLPAAPSLPLGFWGPSSPLAGEIPAERIGADAAEEPEAGHGETPSVEPDAGTDSLPGAAESAESVGTADGTGSGEPSESSGRMQTDGEQGEERETLTEQAQRAQRAERAEDSLSLSPPVGLSNETAYEPDLAALAARERVIPPLALLVPDATDDADASEMPVVLILHTHGTEGYAGTEQNGWRTNGEAESVVGIGSLLARRLRDAGIGTVHLTEAFDAEDFNTAYYRAARAIRETLAEYPTVRYIFDLHRDSCILPDGSAFAPVCALDGGGRAARLMFVVGTDEAGADHPGWEDNLALALRLARSLEAESPGLTRDINLRSASFNEQYAPGALLIEIGAAANTIEEASLSAELLAEALVQEIKGE